MPIVFRKMALKVANIIKNTSNFSYAIGSAAIEKKMPGRPYTGTTNPAPAQLQMIGPGTPDQDLPTFFGAWPLRVSFDIQ